MNNPSRFFLLAVMFSFIGRIDAQLLTESFDGTTFPPTGWTNVRTVGFASPGTWQRVTTGTNPTCTLHSGAGMGYFNAYSWTGGDAGELSTPALNFTGGTYAVSFWMYRDAGQAGTYDSVSVYANTITGSSGGTRLGNIIRNRNLAPTQNADGWYQYSFNIPASFNTATNYIVFKGTSGFGNRMFIDDILVYSQQAPANVTAISASDSAVCANTHTELYAAGVDSIVYWYADSCGGTLIGTGDSISIAPAHTTTYYARNFKNGNYSLGCTSFTVTVYPVYNIAQSKTICAGQKDTLANGSIADTAGTYTVTLHSIYGCDSTIVLTLTVLAPVTKNISAGFCHGHTYNFNGRTLGQAGTYYDTLTAASGCDSIVALTLSLNSTTGSSITHNICSGGSYHFNNRNLTAPGTYYDTLAAANTCDSIVTLTLTVTLTFRDTITDRVCFGTQYVFNGTTLTQSGNYNDTLSSAGGCDSIVTLQLTIDSAISTGTSQTICFGDSLLFNGHYYNHTGTFTDTLNSASGCDSLAILDLTVLPQTSIAFSRTICFGDSSLFNGHYYLHSGNYTDTLSTTGGCDSLVTLQLQVSPQIITTINQSICSNDSLLFNGVYYQTAGNFTDTLTGATGCDSLVTLALIVHRIDTPVIHQTGNLLSTQSYAAYQWLMGGAPVTGATSQNFAATVIGTYSVQVTDTNGCSMVSAPVNVTEVGIPQISASDITVYPNPVMDELRIGNLPSNEHFNVGVYNAIGELVLATGVNNNVINVQGLAPGMYIVYIYSDYRSGKHIFIKL